MIKRDVAFGVTEMEIADELANMRSDEQARFFNALAKHPWWDEQMYHITRERDLTEEARAFMRQLGKWAEKSTK